MKMLGQLVSKLFPRSRVILVGGGAFAFFNVSNPLEDVINVEEIEYSPLRRSWGHRYDFLVRDETRYFNIENYDGLVSTLSFTEPCIVIAAFTTDEKEVIKSSGVYHSGPYWEEIQNSLQYLIDSVRPDPSERVVVKAIGLNRNGWPEEYIQGLKNQLTELLAEKSVEIDLNNFVFGGGPGIITESIIKLIPISFPYWGELFSYQRSRRTEFYPQSGQLVTCFWPGTQKTVI